MISKLNRFVEPVKPDVSKKSFPPLEESTLAEAVDMVNSGGIQLLYDDKNVIKAFADNWQARHHARIQALRSNYLLKQVEDEDAEKERCAGELDSSTPLPDLEAKWAAISTCPVYGDLNLTLKATVVSMPTISGVSKDVRTGEIVAMMTYKGDPIIIGTFMEGAPDCQVYMLREIESFFLSRVILPSIMDGKADDAASTWDDATEILCTLRTRVQTGRVRFLRALSQLLLLESSENRIKADLVRGAAQ